MRARIAGAEFVTSAGAISLTVSIGAASGTGQTTVDALLAAADAALYQAKAAGRNRVVYAAADDGGGAKVRNSSARGDNDAPKSEKEIKTGKKGGPPVA